MTYGNPTRRFCGTSADDASAGAGTVAWTNADKCGDGSTGDIRVGANTSQASASLAPGESTRWLKCTNFSFGSGVGAVSAGATLLGFRPIIAGGQAGDDAVANANLSVSVKICKAGVIDGTGFTGSSPVHQCTNAQMHYGLWVGSLGTDGVPNDLAGSTLTSANVTASNFGIFVKFTNGDGALTSKVVVDSLELEAVWTEAAVVRLTKTADGPAPRWIGVSATESSIGSRDPKKVEYRWSVQGPNGWQEPTFIDRRPGAGGQTMPLSAIHGHLLEFPATDDGVYVVTCSLYDEDGVLLDAESATITLTAENLRDSFYVDSVAGEDAGPGGSGAPWQTLAYARDNVTADANLYLKGGQVHNVDASLEIPSGLNVAPWPSTGTPIINFGGGFFAFGFDGACWHDMDVTFSNITDVCFYPYGGASGVGVWNLNLASGLDTGSNQCQDFCTIPSTQTCNLCGIWNCTGIKASAFHLFPSESTRFFACGVTGTSPAGSSANGFSRAEGGGNNSTGTRGYSLIACDFDGTGAERGGLRTSAQFVHYEYMNLTNAQMHLYRLSPGTPKMTNSYMHRIENCVVDFGANIAGSDHNPQWSVIRNCIWKHTNNLNAYISWGADVYQFLIDNTLVITNDNGGAGFLTADSQGYRNPNQVELRNCWFMIEDHNGSSLSNWPYLRDTNGGAYAGGGTKLFKNIQGCFWPSGDSTNSTRFIIEGSTRAFGGVADDDFNLMDVVDNNGTSPVLLADLSATFEAPNDLNGERTTCVPVPGVFREYLSRNRDLEATNWYVGPTDSENTLEEDSPVALGFPNPPFLHTNPINEGLLELFYPWVATDKMIGLNGLVDLTNSGATLGTVTVDGVDYVVAQCRSGGAGLEATTPASLKLNGTSNKITLVAAFISKGNSGNDGATIAGVGYAANGALAPYESYVLIHNTNGTVGYVTNDGVGYLTNNEAVAATANVLSIYCLTMDMATGAVRLYRKSGSNMVCVLADTHPPDTIEYHATSQIFTGDSQSLGRNPNVDVVFWKVWNRVLTGGTTLGNNATLEIASLVDPMVGISDTSPRIRAARRLLLLGDTDASNP